MKIRSGINLAHMEGRSFILGREGHIYIDSATASKQHAELSIVRGKIYLRDLDSTNGTYLVKNKSLRPFAEGFVNPLQPIMIGGRIHVINDLLAVASEFAAVDDAETEVEFASGAQQREALRR
ncbi:MAG: FHA domain-containing protein [Gammaproteobacteria bacterium]|nr:FHA domain-containing protein [Gammaproteobacteria bacterium]MDH3448699.1 FHA domain-containing protein [Gammaproteobacteria bacterium]